MNNKLCYQNLENYNEGGFRINSSFQVFFANEQIGNVCIAENSHPEGDDEIICFLPGCVGFQHHPVYDAGSACRTIYEKYYSPKNGRK